MVDAILTYSLNYTYIDGLFGVEHAAYRRSGSAASPASNWPIWLLRTQLSVLAFNLFTNFSLLPLQIVSLIGFITAVGGLLTAAYYLLQYVLYGGLKFPAMHPSSSRSWSSAACKCSRWGFMASIWGDCT